jgi:hypothetical protein
MVRKSQTIRRKGKKTIRVEPSSPPKSSDLVIDQMISHGIIEKEDEGVRRLAQG